MAQIKAYLSLILNIIELKVPRMRPKDPSEFEDIFLLLQKKPLLLSKEIHDLLNHGTAYATL